MAFKSGHEDITYDKVNASIDLQDASAVTANGLRGLITMTNNDSQWDTGTPREFTLNNSFIQADSLINFTLCTNGGTLWTPIVRLVYNVAAGSCKIGMVNARGHIAANSIVYIAYEVVN
tara:strand:+ start:369 stop:725 length:357 start_codon:yes stop_codon:yes gene_type:complete